MANPDLLGTPLVSPILGVTEAMEEFGIHSLDAHSHDDQGITMAIQVTPTDRPRDYLEALDLLGDWWEPSEEITEATTIGDILGRHKIPEEIHLARASGLDWVVVVVLRRDQDIDFMNETLRSILLKKVELDLEDPDALQYDHGDEPWRGRDPFGNDEDDEDDDHEPGDSWDSEDGLLDPEDEDDDFFE